VTEQLPQVYVPVPWVLDYKRDGECTTEFRTMLNLEHHCRNMKKSQHTDFNKDMANKSTSMACRHIWL